jgi:hypothetical protein
LGLGEAAGVEVDDPRSSNDRDRGAHAEHDRDDGQQPLGVRLALIAVVARGLDQQGHDDAGQHPAQEQVVDGVRHCVRDVVGVAELR